MNIPEILDKASALKIAVVGDMILDRYIDGVVDRISPEAPVPVLKITGTRENPGGAGNVVENLRGLGVEVDFFYDVGNTIIKTRVMSGSHHIIRMDDEDAPKWIKYDDIQWELQINIEKQKYNCVVLSDYGKGMISPDVAKNVIELCNMHGIPVVVDTKHQLDLMKNAYVVKCNHKEWHAQDIPFPESPWYWLDDNGVECLVVTNGDKGMQYWISDQGYEVSGNVPGINTDICDPCGAGDTVTAVLAVMTALGEPIDQACELANIAAAEVCKHPGVYAIKKNDLLNLMK